MSWLIDVVRVRDGVEKSQDKNFKYEIYYYLLVKTKECMLFRLHGEPER
jgi:hypothetical protein